MAANEAVQQEVDLNELEPILERFKGERWALIPLLQQVQEKYGYIPPDAIEPIARGLRLFPSEVQGVVTFYSQFYTTPRGKNIIRVCRGTACHVKGAPLVHDALRRHLGIAEEDDTDPQGLFTLEKVACLGCCTLAPVVQIDQVTYGHLSPDAVEGMLRDFLEWERRRLTAAKKRHRLEPVAAEGEIRIGLGSCCIARGSGKVREALDEALAETGARAVVKRVGCVGMCHQTPLLEVLLPGQPPHLYARVNAEDARAIVLRHFRPKGIRRRLLSGLRRALEAVLTHPQRCAYPPSHVRTITGPAATRQNILAGLEWLQEQLDSDDNATAVVYYSGHGWRNGDQQLHYRSGHPEGNIDCYAAFRLCGETKLAGKIKTWLDHKLDENPNLFIDLYSWRVLAFGRDYSAYLDIPEYDLRFRKTIEINGKPVVGFFHRPDYDIENFWIDGIGQMACAFISCGGKYRGYFYANQLDKLIFEKRYKNQIVHALPYTVNHSGGYEWVNFDSGFISTIAWYIFAKNEFNPLRFDQS